MTPQRETRPYVGFSPTTPQNAAGWRIDPPVSVPRLAAHRPAATAAELPPELPPGTRVGSHGFFVGWYAERSVELPIANSSQLSLPSTIASSARSRVTTVASYGGTQPARILDAAVVARPFVTSTSLSPIGTPARRPSFSFAARLRSTSRAAASAPSRSTTR